MNIHNPTMCAKKGKLLDKTHILLRTHSIKMQSNIIKYINQFVNQNVNLVSNGQHSY